MNHFRTMPMKKCTRRQQLRRVAEASARFNATPKLSKKKLRKLELARKKRGGRKAMPEDVQAGADELNDRRGMGMLLARLAAGCMFGTPKKITLGPRPPKLNPQRKLRPQQQKAFGREQKLPPPQVENDA